MDNLFTLLAKKEPQAFLLPTRRTATVLSSIGKRKICRSLLHKYEVLQVLDVEDSNASVEPF